MHKGFLAIYEVEAANWCCAALALKVVVVSLSGKRRYGWSFYAGQIYFFYVMEFLPYIRLSIKYIIRPGTDRYIQNGSFIDHIIKYISRFTGWWIYRKGVYI